jgi:uncharacterized protein
MHPLLAFYLVAVGITSLVMVGFSVVRRRDRSKPHVLTELFRHLDETGGYANALSIGAFARKRPAALLILGFAAAPSLAALIVSAFSSGQYGLRRLLSRLAPWRSPVPAWHAICVYVAIFVVLCAVAEYLYRGFVSHGTPEELTKVRLVAGSSPFTRSTKVVYRSFIDEGGSLEELGWRGYALPLLISGWRNPWAATAVLAVLWWGWHLPREVPVLLRRGVRVAWLTGQAGFLMLCVTEAIVITEGFILTGGSVWPAVLVHGGANVWTKAVGSPEARGSPDVRSAVVTTAALAVLLVAAAKA